MPLDKLNHDEGTIGQRFVKADLITSEQLSISLKRQKQTGEKLGSILLQLGYITTEQLLEFLKTIYGTPSIDLFKITIEPSVLHSISHEQMCRFLAIPIHDAQKSFYIAMVDPNDIDSINELEFILGKKIQPVVVPHSQMTFFLEYIRRRGGHLRENLSGEAVEMEMAATGDSDVAPGLDKLLTQLGKYYASDLLISAGLPPCMKVDNEIVRLPQLALSPTEVETIAKEMMTADQWTEFGQNGGVDFGLLKHDIGRFRVNVYRQRSSISISVRSISEYIPSLDSLGFPESLDKYIYQTHGLILIVGPTGHGKSTTVAAIVDALNSKRACNIVTIEDPIEFLHKHKLSNINQREVGRDTPSFREGLRHVFRQAADVIVIGEMRDPESFEIAVNAAGTGHLVISTMHANNTTVAIERVIETFPQDKQDQIRIQFAEVLIACIGQRLVPLCNEKGRVLAYEKLASSSRIKNMIRENKCHQIRTLFQQSSDDYVSIDVSLASLAISGKITEEDALLHCSHPATLKNMISQKSVSSRNN